MTKQTKHCLNKKQKRRESEMDDVADLVSGLGKTKTAFLF